MAVKVGIPRGLFYYKFYPLWKTFFIELGAEIIESDFTNKQILDRGVKSCVDEACLPVKVFHGHVLDIKDKVDFLFIPRLTSISMNEYICPKFGGLPDMIRNTLKDLPVIIDTEINMRKSKRDGIKGVYEIGSFIVSDKNSIRRAYKKALVNYQKYCNELKKGKIPSEMIGKKLLPAYNGQEKVLNIGVIGHVYNLYDDFLNMNLFHKFRENGVCVTTIEMVEKNIINDKVNGLPKKMFWNFGRKAMGSALHFLERNDIDGVIYIMSFGCGLDSFICDLIERKIRRKGNIPFIVLTLDEHSGEAGLDTRIEAFIDMIRWRNKNEDNISTFR